LKPYLAGKLLQMLCSILLAALLQAQTVRIPVTFWVSVPLSIAVILKFLHKKQKKCSISQLVGV
jgi:hypothetical protein